MKPKTAPVLQVGVKSLLVNTKGEFLILKRNSVKYKGLGNVWDIPGGRIDGVESLAQNLKREVKEETGISRVTLISLLAAQDIIKPGFHVIRLTYLSRVTSDKVVLDNVEHTEYLWVTLEDLVKTKGLDPYLKGILKDKTITSFIKDKLE
jgi:ADP-ribose pyrophosphatase YjhB (NUDIX family)